VVLHDCNINVQLENGEINQSLGLAWYVPLQISNITLYVQIHIICNPAYNILLSWPFDVLTESVIHNYNNEDQMIPIFNLNSGQHVTILTIPQSCSPRKLDKLTIDCQQWRSPFIKSNNTWSLCLPFTSIIVSFIYSTSDLCFVYLYTFHSTISISDHPLCLLSALWSLTPGTSILGFNSFALFFDWHLQFLV
jgi:hypothetical protein